jgi:hypothetical protein
MLIFPVDRNNSTLPSVEFRRLGLPDQPLSPNSWLKRPHKKTKKALINSENVIPAQAGIHKNQQTGSPPARG